MSERAPIGMIGLRGWGNQLRAGILEAGNLELAAAASRSPESIERVKEQWPEVEIVDTFDELVARDDIVGVVSNMPNHFHLEHIVKAARAGKHIFVEKPVTNTVAEARQAVEVVKAGGIICMVGHNDRMHPVRRRMRELVESGRPGRVVALEGNQSHRGGLRPPDPRRAWRRRPDLCPAVPLMQLGVHLIDTVNYLLGRRALRVTAVHRSLLMGGGQTDLTSQIIEYPGEVLFTLNSYYVTPGTLILNVYGTEANIYSHDGPGGRRLLVRTADGREEEVTAGWGGFADPESGTPPPACAPTTAEMRQFGECLLTGWQPEVTVEAALDALAPVEASIVSSREGRTVALDELL